MRRIAIVSATLLSACSVNPPPSQAEPVTGGPPGAGWVATKERFVDPESGKLVTVFYQPATGERRYVAG